MKCFQALKLFQNNGIMYKYSLIFIFLFGAFSTICFNKFWNYISYADKQPQQLILRRPFSIVDFDEHDIYVADDSSHELIIRETEVDVVCKYNYIYFISLVILMCFTS